MASTNGSQEDKLSDQQENQTCEHCKKSFLPSSLLIHIAKSTVCKTFYGPKFQVMKKTQQRERKRKYRENMSLEERKKNLEKGRKSYSENSDLKKKKKLAYVEKKEKEIMKKEKRC